MNEANGSGLRGGGAGDFGGSRDGSGTAPASGVASAYADRWTDVERPYTGREVERLRRRASGEHGVARRGAERLWGLLRTEDYVAALRASTPEEALRHVRSGCMAIHVRGRLGSSEADEPGAGEASGPGDTEREVVALVRRINERLLIADHWNRSENGGRRSWLAPIVAEAHGVRGDPLGAFEAASALIDAGSAALHVEDRVNPARVDDLDGKLLMPASQFVSVLIAARLAADVLDVPTLLVARTDAGRERVLPGDGDVVDREFLTGQRTEDGSFRVRDGLEPAIARGLACAPYADVIWCEMEYPDLDRARRFAEAIHDRYPDKLLAYSCVPTFDWLRELDAHTIFGFQRELGAMGYRFHFVTLAGFRTFGRRAAAAASRRLAAVPDVPESSEGRRGASDPGVVGRRGSGGDYSDLVVETLARGRSTALAAGGAAPR